MSRSRSNSAESTGTILTCTSEEYDDFFNNEKLQTEPLSDDVLRNVICQNSAKLRAADRRYRLDDLLSAMLEHAPHPLGRRYVAVSLHVAHRKGEDGVVNAAKAWLDNLFLPSPFVKLSFSLHLPTPVYPTPDGRSAYNLQSYKDRARQQPNSHSRNNDAAHRARLSSGPARSQG